MQQINRWDVESDLQRLLRIIIIKYRLHIFSNSNILSYSLSLV